MEILQSGLIETDEQLMELTERYRQAVIPSENEDLDLTHWWVIMEDGVAILYVGTPETFATYVMEQNAGVQ